MLRVQLADLLAPVPLEQFEAEVFGRRPLHIPVGGDLGAKVPIDWAAMRGLLALRSHWGRATIELILNSRPVQPDFYLDEVETLAGPVRRANPAKVQVFLDMGASLVANSLEEVSPAVRAIADCLSDHYSARAGANAYCSFGAIQAFASHCDLHEVFALQCEGEKTWRIYENRAQAPVEPLAGEDAQALIDRTKGRVLTEVRMRAGDLLYIPRGFYHDALATSDASLHVTFSLAPLTGRYLFRLLEELAVEDAAFREYLPDARAAGGELLRDRLMMLAERASALMGSARFASGVGQRQRQLVDSPRPYRLPARQPLRYFARTAKDAEMRATSDGLSLRCGGQDIAFGPTGPAVEWLLQRRAFSLQELLANFQYLDEERLTGTIETLEALGLVRGYVPDV